MSELETDSVFPIDESPQDVASPASRSGDTVSALERGVAVLRCFTPEVRLLGNNDLARLTGIPKPTVTRLAVTLVSLGLLKRDSASDRFALGPGVLSMSRSFLAGLDVRSCARPRMAELADWSGGAVYLGVRDGLEMVLIEALRARSSILAPSLDVGSRVPLIDSALGRAYLGAIEQRELDQLLETIRLARGSEWPRMASGLMAALDQGAADGFCVSLGSWHREIHSVAVPLIGPKGEVMALNCGGPSFQFPEARLRDEIAPRLARMAEQIARDIGGSVGRWARKNPSR